MSAYQRIGVVLLLGLAFLLGTWWRFAGAQGERKVVSTWELTKVARSAEGWARSQELAAEGWELVTVDATAYYLQRPK